MKKIVVALMLITFAAAVSFAADSVTYEGTGKKGAVTFPHKKHQEKFECAKCHEGTPAKIIIDSKDKGHEFCKDCHKANGGPTKCGECHAG